MLALVAGRWWNDLTRARIELALDDDDDVFRCGCQNDLLNHRSCMWKLTYIRCMHPLSYSSTA